MEGEEGEEEGGKGEEEGGVLRVDACLWFWGVCAVEG